MRKLLNEMTPVERGVLLAETTSRYEAFKARHLSLDMSRGKPCAEQADLSLDILEAIKGNEDCFSEDGTDCRNYGAGFGIGEMSRIFAEILQVPQKNVVVGGVSSLRLMYDTIARAMLKGLYGSEKPWCKYDKISFICPVPGYDRHCSICEYFGINMISVPLVGDGPDMDMVEKLAAEDETIKGMWCVPVYSNYTGECYSDETLKRIAKMPAKAKDFTVFVDNAYAVHDLYDEPVCQINLFDECVKAGNSERCIYFASTSKITYAGGGVSCVAFGDESLKLAKEQMAVQFLSHDKLNQLRHARVLKDLATIRERMSKHAKIIEPKFTTVTETLSAELDGFGAASWNNPRGGYFICLKLLAGSAKEVVSLCAEAGVKLTSAGAGFPHGIDPDDCFIRIAPTYPSCEELKTAAELLSVCILLSALKAD